MCATMQQQERDKRERPRPAMEGIRLAAPREPRLAQEVDAKLASDERFAQCATPQLANGNTTQWLPGSLLRGHGRCRDARPLCCRRGER